MCIYLISAVPTQIHLTAVLKGIPGKNRSNIETLAFARKLVIDSNASLAVIAGQGNLGASY